MVKAQVLLGIGEGPAMPNEIRGVYNATMAAQHMLGSLTVRNWTNSSKGRTSPMLT